MASHLSFHVYVPVQQGSSSLSVYMYLFNRLQVYPRHVAVVDCLVHHVYCPNLSSSASFLLDPSLSARNTLLLFIIPALTCPRDYLVHRWTSWNFRTIVKSCSHLTQATSYNTRKVKHKLNTNTINNDNLLVRHHNAPPLRVCYSRLKFLNWWLTYSFPDSSSESSYILLK